MPRFLLCSLPSLALLALTLACGSGGDAPAPNDPPAGLYLPAELVGEWHYQQILDQNCDPDTGQWFPPRTRAKRSARARWSFRPCLRRGVELPALQHGGSSSVGRHGGSAGLDASASHEQRCDPVSTPVVKTP